MSILLMTLEILHCIVLHSLADRSELCEDVDIDVE